MGKVLEKSGELDVFQFLEQVIGRETFCKNFQFVAWFYPQLQALLKLQSKEEIMQSLERITVPAPLKEADPQVSFFQRAT